MFFLSLSLILILGVILGYLLNKIKLPSLIGYLLIGILLGYFGLIDQSVLDISSELRKIALIIILIKAGLTLNINDLKKVGRPAIFMSFVPATFEMITFGLLGPFFFNLTYNESFIMGACIGAVSPAVVVPRMVKMIEEGRGVKKGIPQIILAGSSMDDIVMIVCYSAFMTMEQGNNVNFMTYLNIPISIISGVLVGIIIGLLLVFLFKKVHVRDSIKLALVLGIAFGLVYLEKYLENYFGYSSLLSAITIGIIVLAKRSEVAKRLSIKCSKLWVVAEIFLFTLVGASIKISYFSTYLLPALALIACGLFIRLCAVFLSLTKTNISFKERIFVAIAYIPKATVQAAIGGGLLDLGNSLNNDKIIGAGIIVLSVSVVAILFTAPLGAFLTDLTYKKLIPLDNVNEPTVENK
jgi:NhaP-type Na+/H+ and K+/H+ antiporters